MSMAGQLLLLWGLAVLIPIMFVIYIEFRFKKNDKTTTNLFETVQRELDQCHKREEKLSARVTELERQINGIV